jgi:superfamily II DNA/RNA helicase
LSSTFADLGVPAEAVRSLRARGITSPFPIQALAIPPALAGHDICGRAPTGSGKTIAFGLPLVAGIGGGRPRRPQALILSPTRELAGQIEAEMKLLMGTKRRHRVTALYGGVGFAAQVASLRRGVDVAVACPGRLKDLIGRGALDLVDVSIVVIDEADRMSDMGFLPDVKAILDQVRPDRQTLLFSATLDGDVDVLVRRYQRSPVRVAVESDEKGSAPTTHHWIQTRREERLGLVADLVVSNGSTIVFCRTKHGTDRVAQQLGAAGVKAVPLHGGRSQAQRERALASFTSGRAQALVATDVAARGIHVDGVRCVVHFDLPATPKDYLHRSGRTGRAGADGVVISLVTQADLAPAKALQKAVGHPISMTSGTKGIAGARPASQDRPRVADPTVPRSSARRPSHEPARRRARQTGGRRSERSATPTRQPEASRGRRTSRTPRRPNRAA